MVRTWAGGSSRGPALLFIAYLSKVVKLTTMIVWFAHIFGLKGTGIERSELSWTRKTCSFEAAAIRTDP
jgi:hypothetical protein